MLLGNTELAAVLLTACEEPIRAALLGARICNQMAERLPIESENLKADAARHEAFAVDLLELAPNQQAATLLLLAPSRHWERNVLQLAVHSDNKGFVAHRRCQHLCDRSLFGDVELETPGERPLYAMLDSRFQKEPSSLDWLLLVLHALVPVNGWLVRLRRSPRCPPEGTWHWHDFYRIPLVKKTLRTVLYQAYAALFSFVTLADTYTDMNAWFKYYAFDVDPLWLLAWWTAALLLDEWNQWHVKPSTFESGLWNKYDYFNLSLTSLALFLKLGPVSSEQLNDMGAAILTPLFAALFPPRAMPAVDALSSSAAIPALASAELLAAPPPGAASEALDAGRMLAGRMLKPRGHGGTDAEYHPSDIYRFEGIGGLEHGLLAFLNVMVWCRVLQHYSMQQDIGVLILMITHMLRDMQLWMLLSVIFLFSFGVTFAAINHSEESPIASLISPWWATRAAPHSSATHAQRRPPAPKRVRRAPCTTTDAAAPCARAAAGGRCTASSSSPRWASRRGCSAS